MTDSSTNSTSYATILRKYRELKRKFLTQASEQDLKNVMILMAHDDVYRNKQIKEIVRIFTVAAVAERLVQLEKKGKPNVPKRRNRSTAGNASDGPETVLRQDSIDPADSDDQD